MSNRPAARRGNRGPAEEKERKNAAAEDHKRLSVQRNLRLLTCAEVLSICERRRVCEGLEEQLAYETEKFEKLLKAFEGCEQVPEASEETEFRPQRMTLQDGGVRPENVERVFVSKRKDLGWLVCSDENLTQVFMYFLKTGAMVASWEFTGKLQVLVDAVVNNRGRYVIMTVKNRNREGGSLRIYPLEDPSEGKIVPTNSVVTALVEDTEREGFLIGGTENGGTFVGDLSKLLDNGNYQEPEDGKMEAVTAIHRLDNRFKKGVLVGDKMGTIVWFEITAKGLEEVKRLDLLPKPDSAVVKFIAHNDRYFSVVLAQNKGHSCRIEIVELLRGKQRLLLQREKGHKFSTICCGDLILMRTRKKKNFYFVTGVRKSKDPEKKTKVEYTACKLEESLKQELASLEHPYNHPMYLYREEKKVIQSAGDREPDASYCEDFHYRAYNIQQRVQSIDKRRFLDEYQISIESHPFTQYAYLTSKTRLLAFILEVASWLEKHKIVSKEPLRRGKSALIFKDYHTLRKKYQRRSIRVRKAFKTFRAEAEEMMKGMDVVKSIKMQQGSPTMNIQLELPMEEDLDQDNTELNTEKLVRTQSFEVPLQCDVKWIKRRINSFEGIPSNQLRLRINRETKQTARPWRYLDDDSTKLTDIEVERKSCRIQAWIDNLLVDRLVKSSMRCESVYPPEDMKTVVRAWMLEIDQFREQRNRARGGKIELDDDEERKREAEDLSAFVDGLKRSLELLIAYYILDSGLKEGAFVNFLTSFAISPENEHRVRAFQLLDSMMDNEKSAMDSAMQIEGEDEKKYSCIPETDKLDMHLARCNAGSTKEGIQCLMALELSGRANSAKTFIQAVMDSEMDQCFLSAHYHILRVRTILKIGTWQQALLYIREMSRNSGKTGLDDSLHRLLCRAVFNWFHKNGDLRGLIKVAFLPLEQEELETFLKSTAVSGESEKDDGSSVLLLYHLHRGDVDKGLAVKDPRFTVESEVFHGSDEERTTLASTIISAYRKTFPSIYFDGSFQEAMKPRKPT